MSEISVANVSYGPHGLVPAVVQDTHTKDVLMLAWMNEEALRLTLTTGHPA